MPMCERTSSRHEAIPVGWMQWQRQARQAGGEKLSRAAGRGRRGGWVERHATPRQRSRHRHGHGFPRREVQVPRWDRNTQTRTSCNLFSAISGVSGSCSMQTCWRKLSGFNTTSAALRVKYHQAVRKISFAKASRRAANRERRERFTIGTGFNGLNFPGIGLSEQLQDPGFEQLFYLEQSPTFCAITKGRQCLSPDNCSALCCGRGYTTKVLKLVEKCRCRFSNGRCCNVICDWCEKYEDRYYCK